jgi:hypothetical protein
MADKSTATTRAPESKGPVTENTKAPETNEGLATTSGREAQVKVEDERLKRLNEQNREGHEKNMKKIEEHGEQVAKAADAGPTSGREWNRNTPRVDKDGGKHWD